MSTTPAINFSPVSLTPLNSLSPVSTTPVININSWIFPQIFEKIQNGSNGILGCLGDTDSWKKPEVENLVSDSLEGTYALKIICVFFEYVSIYFRKNAFLAQVTNIMKSILFVWYTFPIRYCRCELEREVKFIYCPPTVFCKLSVRAWFVYANFRMPFNSIYIVYSI